MLRRGLILCVALLLTSHAAALNRWRPSTAKIGGGIVRSMDAGHGSVYAATWGDGLFVSTDEAESWREAGLPGRSALAVAVDPNVAGVIYAGTMDGLYLTRDDGGRWSRLDPVGVARACVVDPTDSDVVYVGVDGVGVLRSGDGGVHWDIVGDALRGLLIFGLDVDWEDSARVYAATSDGIYLSDSRGDAWIPVGPLRARVTAVSVHPTDPNVALATGWGVGIYRTVDRGATWQQVLNPELRRWLYQVVNSVAYDRDDPSTVYVGAFGGGILHSHDGGDSWEVIPTANGWIYSLVTDPGTGRIYAGTSGDGVYRKEDVGHRWGRKASGLANAHVKTVRVDPERPVTVFAATWGGGVYRSEDAARTWTPASDGLTTRVLPDFTIHPENTARLYAATDGGGVFRSDDQGERWTSIKDGLVAGIIVAVDVDPTNPDIVYAGSEGIGIMRSLNQGDTWGPTGLDSGALWSIAINPSDPDIMLAGSWGFARFGADGRGILRSADRGATWEFVLESVPAVSLEFDPTDHSVVYAGLFGDGVYRSDDAGLTWRPINNGLDDDAVWEVAPDASAAGQVYAGTWGGGVFVTVDGGEKWEPLNRGLESLNVYSVTMDPTDTQNVYAGTSGGVFHLRRSLIGPRSLSQSDELALTEWAEAKTRTELLPNFPSPANPETWIPFTLEVGSEVNVQITTPAGNVVRRFDLGWIPAGSHDRRDSALRWDGKDAFGQAVASGVYFATLRAGQARSVRRIFVAK
ncbi:hypothetical protein HN371_26780 [Candidatus Poribacteria bacterium]|jgi:photosystem II stability/assembly factor-like uncharacterized protein|nr:hypothetical protein [Candidatus Poribacteria bacterium]MBT7805960.1 hypothetical protein [Candidatus Poribacteria bacterium]